MIKKKEGYLHIGYICMHIKAIIIPSISTCTPAGLIAQFQNFEALPQYDLCQTLSAIYKVSALVGSDSSPSCSGPQPTATDSFSRILACSSSLCYLLTREIGRAHV